jgi:hemolysin III
MISSTADTLSSGLHLVGVLLAAVLGRWALKSAGNDPERLIGAAFAIAWIGLFAASAAFHGLPEDRWYSAPLLASDHSGIFVLVAASYTPLVLVLRRPAVGQFLILVWTIGIGGLLAAVGAFSLGYGDEFDRYSWAAHLVHALLPIVLYGGDFIPRLPRSVLACFIGSLLVYALGFYFYGAGESWAAPWGHVVWHAAIVAACPINFAGLRILLVEID